VPPADPVAAAPAGGPAGAPGAARVVVTVRCEAAESFRVRQVAGLFDLGVERARERTFAAEVPAAGEAWRIGAIVGPSGSGKTTVAREAFGDRLWRPPPWPAGRAVIDGFGDRAIKTVAAALTAVGLSSPPSWVRPYDVLSNGERFRCDLARALLSGAETVVFDEFSSVVDRTAAKVGSAAVGRAVRAGRGVRRFVAVSCHYDILPWLEADWVTDMATGRLSRRRLRRPDIELEVFRCARSAWGLFGPHHYLSARLHRSAQCYLGTWCDRPAAFAAVLPMTGRAGYRRVSRLVVLPEMQGVGIGSAVLEAVCELYHRRGERVGITTGHPGLIGRLLRSPRWRRLRRYRLGREGNRAGLRRRRPRRRGSLGRCLMSFRYRPARPPSPRPSAGPPEGAELQLRRRVR